MKLIAAFALLLCFLSSCRKDKGAVDFAGFPPRIGSIIQDNCATSGCHSEKSYTESGGLNLSSWDKMFNGGNNNSVLIPFRYDLSKMFSYSNHYHEIGPTQHHQVNKTNLSEEQVLLIRDWIIEGGKNRSGEMKFPDHTKESKVFVANQGCDLIDVFDARTRLMIRAFEIGNESRTESPHDLMISPDGEVSIHILLSE